MTVTQRRNVAVRLEGLEHYRTQELQLVRQCWLLPHDLGVKGVEASRLGRKARVVVWCSAKWTRRVSDKRRVQGVGPVR